VETDLAELDTGSKDGTPAADSRFVADLAANFESDDERPGECRKFS